MPQTNTKQSSVSLDSAMPEHRSECAKLRDYLDAANSIILALDVQGRVTFINRYGCNLLGLTNEEIIGQSWFDKFLPAEDHRETGRLFLRMTAAELPHSYYENLIIDSAGTAHLVAWRNSAVRDKAGNVVELLAYGIDITESRRAIQESDERFRLLFDNNPAGAMVIERNTLKIIMVNNQLSSMTGYLKDELLGGQARDLFQQETRAALKSLLTADESDHGNELREIPLSGKIGNMIFCDVVAQSLTLDARECVALFFLDVTDRKITQDAMRQAVTATAKAQEAAESANRAKSEFLATVSHELRTPLSPIIGFADLLLDSALTEDQREQVNLIRVRAKDLIVIVNQILDISKIEAGRLEIFVVPCRLASLLRETLASHQINADKKGLKLSGALAPDIPETLLFDPRLVRQILDNLLRNAITFTQAGEVRLDISMAPLLETLENAPQILRFEVKDTGPGIPENKLASIFEPFTSVDASMTRSHSGAGLGLSIALRLARAMGGDLTVAARHGEGSIFTLSLPAVPAASGNQEQARQKHLLLVEDDTSSRMLAKTFLENAGHKVSCATNGNQAVSIFEKGDVFDLVLMDLEMPGMDGITATRLLREIESKTAKRTPIIAFTAHSASQNAEILHNKDFISVINKPIKKSDFLQTVADALATHGH